MMVAILEVIIVMFGTSWVYCLLQILGIMFFSCINERQFNIIEWTFVFLVLSVCFQMSIQELVNTYIDNLTINIIVSYN